MNFKLLLKITQYPVYHLDFFNWMILYKEKICKGLHIQLYILFPLSSLLLLRAFFFNVLIGQKSYGHTTIIKGFIDGLFNCQNGLIIITNICRVFTKLFKKQQESYQKYTCKYMQSIAKRLTDFILFFCKRDHFI